MAFYKKMGLVSAVAASLFTVSWGAYSASETATVNITATVVDNTCTADWNASGINIDMGRVSPRDFGSDKVGASKPFELKLTNCGSGATNVKVTATGTPDTADAGLFKNVESNGATGLALRIKGDSSQATQMKPNGDGEVEYKITDGAAEMTFLAELVQTGTTAPVTGAVKGTVTLTVAYQ